MPRDDYMFSSTKNSITMNVVEALFYKERFIYKGTVDMYNNREENHDDYVVKIITDKSDKKLTKTHRDFLYEYAGKTTVQERLDSDICTLFLVIEDATGKAVGASWGLHPENETVWHDKTPVHPGTTLLFNGYIDPNHRRQGIFTLLHFTSVRFVFENISDEFIAVLEKSNSKIRNAYEKFGWKIHGENHLIKCFGINIFATTSKIEDDNRDLHFVLLRNQFP